MLEIDFMMLKIIMFYNSDTYKIIIGIGLKTFTNKQNLQDL